MMIDIYICTCIHTAFMMRVRVSGNEIFSHKMMDYLNIVLQIVIVFVNAVLNCRDENDGILPW